MLKELYGPIYADLMQAERVLSDVLVKEREPNIAAINRYIVETPGKRLRPALVLLAFFSVMDGRTYSEEAYKKVMLTCSILECIHMASLVHDDVIDHADIRHNKPSIVHKWGMEVAVPQGVYLYSLALKLMAESQSLDIVGIMGHTVKNLCRGELSQVLGRNLQLTIPTYLTILKQKTGVLFSAAVQSGGVLAGATKHQRHQLKHFGNALGIAFQIMDDYMDIMGNRDELKKDPGQDFELGEWTLPILLYVESLSDLERKQFHALITQKNEEALLEVRNALSQREDILEKTHSYAVTYLDKAEQALSALPKNDYTQTLYAILEYVKERGLIKVSR